MDDLNPLTGKLYLEALHMTRVAREAYVLICGKYPHPQTIVPGGISSTITPHGHERDVPAAVPVLRLLEEAGRIWDDLPSSSTRRTPRTSEVGRPPVKNLIDTGIWDHPDAYDATYANAAAWGERRWATPGVILDGELVTTDLHAINIGVEEFVEHSYYEEWRRRAATALSRPTRSATRCRPYHPWNKVTEPRPQARTGRRSTPGTRRRAGTARSMEAGAYCAALEHRRRAKTTRQPLHRGDGTSLKLRVPKGALPELELEWQCPRGVERLRAQPRAAYCIAYTALVAYDNWLTALDLRCKGETRVSTPFEVPQGASSGASASGARVAATSPIT